MAAPLTLDQLKAHLKLDPAAGPEDALLGDYLSAAGAAFRQESKRRWPVASEPVVTGPLAYVDPAALGEDEQQLANHWLRLTLGHWYENRATVAVGLTVVEVPETAKKLMVLLRESTL